MRTEEHPQSALARYVLGALDADAAMELHRHLDMCAVCRDEVDALQTLVAELLAASPPPSQVKQRLLERVGAPLGQARARWAQALAAGTLVLAIAFGAALAAARQQIADRDSALAQGRQQLEQLQSQLAHEQQVVFFVSAPQTLQGRLSDQAGRAAAILYLQHSSAHAVLHVARLPRAAPGTVYQFWLARPGLQIAGKTFDVAPDGSAVVAIDAPDPLGQYDQVMVTVEPSGGSARPSAAIVLSGALPTS